MKRSDWQNVFGKAPDAFRERVNDTLTHLEEEKNMRKRTKFSTVLIAAALSAALLAGAGMAASQLNIFHALDTADPIVPLEGANALVATHLGVIENDYLRATVEEGVYDGSGAIVKLRVEPIDPDKYVVLGRMTDVADVGDGYITEDSVDKNGITQTEIVGRKDGKEIIYLGTPQLLIAGSESPDAEANGEEVLFNSYRDEPQPDGSILFWISGMKTENLPDTLNISLNIQGYDTDFNQKYGSIDGLTFDLVKANTARSVRLVPTGDGKAERFELKNAEISFTEVRGYLTADYAYEQAEGEEMGVTLKLRDADGSHIATGSGATQVSDGLYHETMEIQSFEDLPETLILDVKVIGEDKILGSIECRVQPIGESSDSH